MDERYFSKKVQKRVGILARGVGIMASGVDIMNRSRYNGQGVGKMATFTVKNAGSILHE